MISIIFIVLASICKSIKDTLNFHFETSVFRNLGKFWCPAISWKNKYKDDLKTPKFFGATTFFVWITDGWHLFDFLQIVLTICAIVFYTKIVWCIVDIFIFYCIFTICFELIYRMLRK